MPIGIVLYCISHASFRYVQLKLATCDHPVHHAGSICLLLGSRYMNAQIAWDHSTSVGSVSQSILQGSDYVREKKRQWAQYDFVKMNHELLGIQDFRLRV